MNVQVRVRYAPSPTGYPHIGNIRTALFNWLFARKNNGQFIVRVEDTDQERLVVGAVDSILEGLDWLGIDWDEGPRVGGPFGSYFQSERLDHYIKASNDLIQNGKAYRCYCTKERLAEVRESQKLQKRSIGYDGYCRNLTRQQLQSFDNSSTPYVVRFKMPEDGLTSINDIIRGAVEWQHNLLDDFVLIKSDGFPTYHLAVVVDDYLMNISHVLRAEEWLSSTPRHILLYEALGFTPPKFGHLPMILGPDRSKLSKRHGATSILEYRDAGYLPDALRNFMVLLGWSLDDHSDVIPMDVIRDSFSLDRVGKPAAIFDIERLQWMNGVYIRELSDDALAELMLAFVDDGSHGNIEKSYLMKIVPLIKERIKTLVELPDTTSYFFEDDFGCTAGDLVQKGMDIRQTETALRSTVGALTDLKLFTAESLEECLRLVGSDLGLKPREFFGLVRTSITGRTATPPLFDLMAVLGDQRVIDRLNRAITEIG
ncbi:MAG: glutamate--tRNA ligase [Chloroflexota bacterium]|nr:glutamate--tRNA ligase [Chloroflexota bacterium]